MQKGLSKGLLTLLKLNGRLKPTRENERQMRHWKGVSPIGWKKL
jgi:hypothetical protein